MSDHAHARLVWSVPDALSDDQRRALLGPGAPFELTTRRVRGYDELVFVNQPRNLRAMFDAATARQPDLPLMVAGERVWTYATAQREIDAVAGVLWHTYGVRPGDRVAIVAANSPEYGLAMWATVSIGAIVSSLNGWWTAPELRYGIELTTPTVLLGDERRLARLDDGALASGVRTVRLEDLYAEAMAAGPPDPAIDVDVAPDDPAVILFTSGTTGKPKGATLSHLNILHFMWCNLLMGAVGAAMSPTPATPPARPASILSSPMFHVSGMLGILMTGPALGSLLVFPPPGRWDPDVHLELTQQHRISIWSGVPTQFWRLLRHPDLDAYDTSSVMSVGGGGAPFPPELIRELKERMPWVSLGNGYGMSETVGLGTRTGGPLMEAHPDSVGPANATVEVEIRDPLGDPLGEDEVGEIFLRTPAVFLGYWENEAATAVSLDSDGWYHTGDFGRIHDGRLYLESRMRDMILRGGENIYPLEIEHRLVEHPDIEDAAVIGVDHLELGQEVKAFVVLRQGAALSASDVQGWAAANLAAFKVPTHVEFRAQLPYTETGKVLKHLLEAEQRAAV